MSTSYFMLRFLKRKRLQKSGRAVQEINYETTEIPLSCSVGTNKCRICLKYGNLSIFSQDGPFDLKEAIQTYGGIEVSEYDEYPKHLCNTCHKFLLKASLFKKTAQETERLLKDTYEQSSDIDLGVNDDTTDNNGENEAETAKSYNCKICKLIFNSWDKYIMHKTSKHRRNIRIQCPICYGLLTAHLYKRHLERHQSVSHLICDVCGKLYRKDNLIRHLQLHSYDLPFHCQICPYKGRFMESLKIHMRTHTGVRPFSCDKCELRFLTRSNLNRHLLTHKKDRPFKCAECGRGFYTKSDMNLHFKADHAGVKDFSCRLCGNKYGTRKALMRHELRVHKRDKMAKGRMPLYLQAEYQRTEVVL